MARPRPAKAGRSARVQAASSRPTPVHSAISTPLSSAYPSAYPSEDEGEHYVRIGAAHLSLERLSLRDGDSTEHSDSAVKTRLGPGAAKKPFPFLSLPPELRLKIYGFYFAGVAADGAVDLDPDNYKRIHKRFHLLRTCRTVYAEASHFFYSTSTFRLFPTFQYGRFSKTKKPLLARLAPHQREDISTLELRVGPHWNNPPRGWVVNPALGLRDCVHVHMLKVFVTFDPGHPAIQGWRKSDGFYEEFCRKLLDDVLKGLPSVNEVQFDAVRSIKMSGELMQGLLGTALANGRRLSFGPERGWKSLDDADEDEEINSNSMPAMPLMNSGGPVVLAVS